MSDIELILEPLQRNLEKSTEEKSAGDESEVVRTAFGKRNRIIVGRPKLGVFDAKKSGLSAKDIEPHKRKGLNLAAVTTTLSFVPDFGCKFVAADFSISFSIREGAPDSPRPVVIDMRPRETVWQQSYKSQQKSSAKLSGSMKSGFAKVLAELSETRSVQAGGKTVMREVYAFGLRGPEAGWRFQASPTRELAGIYEDLVLLVGYPHGASLFGEIKLAADVAVESLLDRWATVAFGLGSGRPRQDRIFELSSG